MSEKKPISLILIILSIALFCSYHIYYHFINIANERMIENYQKEQDIVETNTVHKIKMEDNLKKEEYLGILHIPKIKLKTGFYNKDSSKNNVSNSVTLLKESIMPNENNSIIYLAAHSGVGHLAYFKDLGKLKINDDISLNINGKAYSYSIVDIYEMVRNGQITVNHNINEKYLVLTTCSKNENMQLVIVAKMFNKI